MADVDAWNAYLWEPGGRVLRNLLGIRDFDELRAREYALVFQRNDELRQGVVTIKQTFDLEHHRAVHRHLFQDVYAWAGEVRTVGLVKGACEFVDRVDIGRMCDEAARVALTTQWGTITRDAFGQAMAEVYAWMNFAHPFREGNGRTAKVVLDHLATRSPFELHYEKVDSDTWNRAAILTMPDRGSTTPQPALAASLFAAIAVERAPAANEYPATIDATQLAVSLLGPMYAQRAQVRASEPPSEMPAPEARATRARRLRAGNEVPRSDYDNPGHAPEAER